MPSRSRHPRKTARPRILVIEDDPQILKLLQEVLRDLGEVIIASDGMAGQQIIHHETVDLVITDILMPRREGLSVVRDLRAWDPHVKIMVITGGDRVFPADILANVAAITGADVTLKKPFAVDRLRSEVSRLLEERRTAGHME
ncbi:MAG: response regulator [Magnetococcales bacterium]|nr:response regulator [Magnetococcales bacterium]